MADDIVRIVANGRPYDVARATTVSVFVASLGFDVRFVIVERNGEPLERARYDDVELADGDRLELVRAVAGG
jgi:thiamine biosynthesis protein ThiS